MAFLSSIISQFLPQVASQPAQGAAISKHHNSKTGTADVNRHGGETPSSCPVDTSLSHRKAERIVTSSILAAPESNMLPDDSVIQPINSNHSVAPFVNLKQQTGVCENADGNDHQKPEQWKTDFSQWKSRAEQSQSSGSDGGIKPLELQPVDHIDPILQDYEIPNHPLTELGSKRRLSEYEFISSEFAYNVKDGGVYELSDASGNPQRFYAQKVKGQEVDAGLNAFILYPVELPADGAPVETKLLFRGTKDVPSVIRDLEVGGAGNESLRIAMGEIKETLNTVLLHIQRVIPDSPLNFQIAGHSLGGADSQNFLGHFLEELVRQRQSRPTTKSVGDFEVLELAYDGFKNIKGIDVFTKNSAGVPLETQQRVKDSLGALRADDLDVNICHVQVKGDIVLYTGECHVGADILPEDAGVSFINIYTNSDLGYAQRHTRNFLGGDNPLSPVGIIEESNKTREGRDKLSKRIKKLPSTLLCNRAVEKVQHCFHGFVKSAFSFAWGR